MKIKAKIFCIGVSMLGMTVFASALKAQDAVPLTFSQGDVLSAELLNSIFSRINSATNEITNDDFIGTWTVTQYMPYSGQPGNGSCRSSSTCTVSGTIDSLDGLTRYRTDTSTFSKSGNTYSFSQQNVSSFANSHINDPESGTYSVIAETAVFKNAQGIFGYFYAKKKSANQIVLQDIKSGSNSFNLLILTKQNQPPLPAKGLSGTASGTSVSLSWTDQSSDEAGFKVQTKTSVSGSWSTKTTTAANATSASVTASSGNNWYRVLATNSNGDSITSNEILVEIQ